MWPVPDVTMAGLLVYLTEHLVHPSMLTMGTPPKAVFLSRPAGPGDDSWAIFCWNQRWAGPAHVRQLAKEAHARLGI